jgi:glycosyltransferase involved in cell wall biosynthesis
MNVLLLNTYAQGGAGVACRRLQSALRHIGLDAALLTQDQLGLRWPFYAERLSFLPHERDASVRFSFSLANFGKDISRHPLVQAADVLHLHWVNQGFLSLDNVAQLARLGKPIVWTLHDMWAFTGGCHYSQGCTRYEAACGHCPCLRRPGPADLSHRIWSAKKAKFPADVHFVACSDWLAGLARSSGLLRHHAVSSIPNPIDTELFKPLTADARAAFRARLGVAPGAKLLLFAAMKIAETRKGFHLLRAALQQMKAQRPDFPLELLLLGKAEPAELATLPYPVHAPGLLRDPAQLAEMYGAADAFAIPSLEDNLPNTVMESLACGTPVAGFRTGGIPEMVGHLEQGHIAPQGDTGALCAGIQWVLAQGDALRAAAREKAQAHYAEAVVAKRYAALYAGLL